MLHHIFLSYSRKDTAIMQRVRVDLNAAGLTLWTDTGIEPGTQSWKDSIQGAIENAGCLVVILSPDAKESVWVKRELDYADAQTKPIFPVLARGSEVDAIPFALIGAQFVDIRTDYQAGLQALAAVISERLQLAQPVSSLPQTARTPSPHFAYPLLTHHQLDPWNVIDQIQLMIWLLLHPARLVSYIEQQGEDSVRKTGAWIISTMAWLPFLLPVLGYSLGTVQMNGQRHIALLFAYLLFLLGWLATGVLGGGDRRTGLMTLTLAGLISFLIFVLIRGLSGLEFIDTGDARGSIGVILIGLTVGLAAGIALTIAPGAVGTLAGVIISVVIFSSLFRIYPGTAGALSGLLMVGLAFLTTVVLESGLRMQRATRWHYLLLVLLALAVLLELWLYLLGGWQVLAG